MSDDSDGVLLSWNMNDDAQSIQSSSCSSDHTMWTSLNMDTSSPATPFSNHCDKLTPSSNWGPIDIDEHSNGLTNTLITRLSELVIKSHLDTETTEDVDNGTITLDSTGTISDDGSDRDWMDNFYDMDLDEELHETYQMGKYIGYSALLTHS